MLMDERAVRRMEELESRLEELLKKAPRLLALKSGREELEQKLKTATEALAGEKALRVEAEKARAELLNREQALKQELEKSRSAGKGKETRQERENSGEAKVLELEARVRKLEEKLAREKKLKQEAADRVAALVRELEEEVKS